MVIVQARQQRAASRLELEVAGRGLERGAQRRDAIGLDAQIRARTRDLGRADDEAPHARIVPGPRAPISIVVPPGGSR